MLDYRYKDFQEKRGELHFEEFLDMVWNDYISEKIVSSAYYSENFDFISALTFDSYRLFQMDDKLTMRIIVRQLESFFFNLFRFKADNFDVGNMEESSDN